jgi:hypothetical protein
MNGFSSKILNFTNLWTGRKRWGGEGRERGKKRLMFVTVYLGTILGII